MLTFLHEARKAGFRIDAYDDEAVGEMTKNERGVPWISKVTLHPRIVYSGDKRPTPDRRGAAAPQGARRLLHRAVDQDRGDGGVTAASADFGDRAPAAGAAGAKCA